MQTTAQLIANFSANSTSGCAPLVVQFQDISSGNPTQWFWDFGNGSTSLQQNQLVTYFIPGSYAVKLVVQNASGKDSVVKNSFITVHQSPTTNFNANKTTGCFPLKVQFTDLSSANSGSITEWTWDFGDGTISNEQHPQHTYLSQGNFSVTLKVKNSFGCITIINRPNFITTTGGVIANFSYNASNGCNLPSNVNFTNTSIGTGSLTYLWNFGDGNSSTQINPSNAYMATGTYTVTLISSNNNGCTDTLTKTNLITIGAVQPNFTVSNNCINSATNFINTSQPTPLSAKWYFEDGTVANSLNATKIFTTTGPQLVKLVVDFGLCKDSITKSISVQPKPIAAFSHNPMGACSPPLNVQFNNTSTGSVSYNWQFGNGGVSTQPSPSFIYTQAGSFNVTLIATSNFGCTDTLKKTNAVVIQPPQISSINYNHPDSSCAPFVATYAATIASLETIVRYEWDFGDGSSIKLGANPTHTYNLPGVYNISLKITTINGCVVSKTFAAAVTVKSKPHASFSATPLVACAEKQIIFSDNSTGAITKWFWEFGDGGTSPLQNPVYNYIDTGFFSVTLSVFNGNCRDSLKIIKYIQIKPPIARFTRTISCDTPFQVRFTDQSLSAETYLWNFGDGHTSSLQNPVHTYTNAGTYNVRLTVTNGTCTHFTTQAVQMIASNPSFNINANSFCKYTNVVFSVANVDTLLITNYRWNFGDGIIKNGSRISSVTHQYNRSGTIYPSLIITDVLGCNKTITHALPITIYGLKAGFINPPGNCINSTIQFTDTSLTDGFNTIQQWIWNYGNGTIDTLTSPPFNHLFTTTGSFDIKLKVTDAKGCYDTVFKPNAVLITKPVANFITADTIKCENNNVNFLNISQGVNLNATWYFGDGAISNAINPQHAYTTSGQYTVSIKVADIFGCTDSLIKPMYVRVANPKAAFNFLVGDTISLCYPFLIEVNNQSINEESIYWSFGDGAFSTLQTPSRFYTTADTFRLVLKANGYGNCVDSVVQNIIVKGPTGSFNYTNTKFCNPDTVTFTATALNNTTYYWDFRDGVTVSTSDSVIKHPYTYGGIFIPKMVLIDTVTGCHVPIEGKETIKVIDINTKIKVPATQFCDSVLLNFYDSTKVINDTIQSYQWNFGDNTISSQINPQHFYHQPGVYKVSLKVNTNFGCTYTDTLAVPIKVTQTPLIEISGDSVGCTNALLQFQGILLKSDTSLTRWSWNFLNGSLDTAQIPKPQFYTNAGNYSITAISSNAGGCSDTAYQNVLLHPSPITHAGIDSVVCRGSSISLQPSGALNYVWSADNTLSCLNCPNPIATPTNLKLYGVRGFNSFGCSSFDSVYINVIQPLKINVSNTDTICIGESTKLIASGADKYLWLPNMSINNNSIFNPIVQPQTTTTYTVIGSDRKSCFTDTAFIPIVVYPIPQLKIDKEIVRENVGNQITLNTNNSLDINSWKWTPLKWLSCYNCPNPKAMVTNTIKYAVTASNSGGCVAKDEITIEALCNGYNIFIPNTFTPNGDGVNDLFYPRGKGLFKVKSLKIFNRWGEIVFGKVEFDANDETFGWDGTSNGKQLTPDVYVYIIDVICNNNQVIPLKGNLTLMR